MNKVEICFAPELFEYYRDDNAVVVIVDVLRATTSICAAFVNGVNKIIPVATVEEAIALKNNGYIVASEKDGVKRDFADFGNSPHHFTNENVGGKDLVYCTTNGTRTIHKAVGAKGIAIGSFPNLNAVSEWVINQNRDVIILCAGWKGKFNLEDSLFAGALAEKLLENSAYEADSDAVVASLDLWSLAKKDLPEYIKKVSQYTRLHNNGNGDSIAHCLVIDCIDVVPVFENNELKVMN